MFLIERRVFAARGDKGRDRMKNNKIYILYTVCAALLLGLLVYIGVFMRTDIYEKRSNDGYQDLTDYEMESQTLGGGEIETTYTFRNLNFDDSRGSLWFYTIHQTVHVYFGDELVYSVEVSPKNAFGKTPGNIWNEIPVYEEDSGKTITVTLVSVYGDKSNNTPEFYYGDSMSIREKIFNENRRPFLLGLAAAMIGIVLVIYGLAAYRRTGGDKGVIMMGLFSLFIGIWKITDVNMMALIIPSPLLRANLAFVSLLLLVIPFALYAKGIFGKTDKFWYAPCLLNAAVIVLDVVLQVTGIKDLRETLWLTHLCLIVLAVAYMVVFVRELKKNGWNKKLKATAFFFLLCLLGMAFDVTVFYLSAGMRATFLGLSAYLVYVLVFGILSVKEVNEMVYLGRKAAVYRNLAYHDQLTGLYSRAVYAADMEKLGVKGDGYCVAMMDLNELKACNDLYGHEQGDRYISESGKIIQNIFGAVGKCYRIGGDEFFVLMKGCSEVDFLEKKQELKKEVERWNRENKAPFRMNIACGFARFDSELDFSLHDTMRRADQVMYQEKYAMKNHCMSI